MAARVEGRQMAVNQKISVKIKEFLGGFLALRSKPTKHVKTAVFIRRNLLCSYSHKTVRHRHGRARKDAYDQRNLSLHPRREHMGWFAVCLCAPYVLQPAVQLLRYRVRVLRGH